jgi:hypothetical protein
MFVSNFRYRDHEHHNLFRVSCDARAVSLLFLRIQFLFGLVLLLKILDWTASELDIEAHVFI